MSQQHIDVRILAAAYNIVTRYEKSTIVEYIRNHDLIRLYLLVSTPTTPCVGFLQHLSFVGLLHDPYLIERYLVIQFQQHPSYIYCFQQLIAKTIGLVFSWPLPECFDLAADVAFMIRLYDESRTRGLMEFFHGYATLIVVPSPLNSTLTALGISCYVTSVFDALNMFSRSKEVCACYTRLIISPFQFAPAVCFGVNSGVNWRAISDFVGFNLRVETLPAPMHDPLAVSKWGGYYHYDYCIVPLASLGTADRMAWSFFDFVNILNSNPLLIQPCNLASHVLECVSYAASHPCIVFDDEVGELHFDGRHEEYTVFELVTENIGAFSGNAGDINITTPSDCPLDTLSVFVANGGFDTTRLYYDDARSRAPFGVWHVPYVASLMLHNQNDTISFFDFPP